MVSAYTVPRLLPKWMTCRSAPPGTAHPWLRSLPSLRQAIGTHAHVDTPTRKIRLEIFRSMFHTGRIAQRSLSNGAGPAVLAQHAVPVRTYPHRRHASTQVQPHYTVLWRSWCSHRTTSTHAWLRCLRKKPSSLGYIQCLELPSVYTECRSAQ